MLNRDCVQPDAANPDAPSQGHYTPVGNRQATKQSPGCLGRIDRTRGALGETRCVIVVCMGKDNCRRGNDAQTMQPVGAAVDHDASATLLNQQRAVPPMLTRPDRRLAARAKKCKLHFPCLGTAHRGPIPAVPLTLAPAACGRFP